MCQGMVIPPWMTGIPNYNGAPINPYEIGLMTRIESMISIKGRWDMTHTIHGDWYILLTFTIKNPTIHVGKSTVRPMGWYLAKL